MDYCFSFVLVEPAVEENIGASARAIKTMGFSDLRLVNPCDHLSVKAKMLAHGSHEILENAKSYTSLKEAIADIDLVIGTSSKSRITKSEYTSSRDLLSHIISKGKTIKNIAIVFGCEESGLSNQDLDQCHITSFIPIAKSFPSLNLSQAVMVYAYSLSENLQHIAENPFPGKPTEAAEFKVLKEKAEAAIKKLGLNSREALAGKLSDKINHLKEEDVHLALSVISAILKDD